MIITNIIKTITIIDIIIIIIIIIIITNQSIIIIIISHKIQSATESISRQFVFSNFSVCSFFSQKHRKRFIYVKIYLAHFYTAQKKKTGTPPLSRLLDWAPKKSELLKLNEQVGVSAKKETRRFNLHFASFLLTR